MIRGLESRISRLEQSRKRRGSYVINCSDPPTAGELLEVSRAKRKPVILRSYRGFLPRSKNGLQTTGQS